MNLHQFRFVREAVRQNFNLTEAAKTLFTSQPGVSKAILELEDELGVDIFRRHGKRIRNLTEPGKRILTSIERILVEVETLKRVGKDFAAQDQGNFVIATTHTQARYALPKVLTEFTKRFPKVRVSIQQGNPQQMAEMLIHDRADIAIATEGIAGIDIDAGITVGEGGILGHGGQRQATEKSGFYPKRRAIPKRLCQNGVQPLPLLKSRVRIFGAHDGCALPVEKTQCTSPPCFRICTIAA